MGGEHYCNSLFLGISGLFAPGAELEIVFKKNDSHGTPLLF